MDVAGELRDQRLELDEQVEEWSVRVGGLDVGNVLLEVSCLCLIEHRVAPRHEVLQEPRSSQGAVGCTRKNHPRVPDLSQDLASRPSQLHVDSHVVARPTTAIQLRPHQKPRGVSGRSEPWQSTTGERLEASVHDDARPSACNGLLGGLVATGAEFEARLLHSRVR